MGDSPYGWPPLLRTSVAAKYVQRSKWTLFRAVKEGELAAIGRRGKSLVFARDDLDRWMRGEPVNPPPTQPDHTAPRSTSSKEASLERLRALGSRSSR